jgi:16S rRNA (adenine1518-N6/adenine1519-N6)-dimethyltransferase
VKKPFGQHFLFDGKTLKKIVDCSNIAPEDTVVEIGPGLGTLTRLLSERAKKVIAIEIDRRLIARLKEALSTRTNVELINTNALRFPYETIKGRFKVVANIPYYITTPLLFKLLEFKEKISTMTLLLQKEVAQRIIASPGSKEYGVLSISMQLYTRPEIRFIIPRKAFSPPPEVDSAVVFFEVSSIPLFKIDNEAFFFKVVKTAFSQRRKTIVNCLKTFKGIKEALQETGIDPKVRPEALSIKDFIKLSEALC